jgi:hypothetical protein
MQNYQIYLVAKTLLFFFFCKNLLLKCVFVINNKSKIGSDFKYLTPMEQTTLYNSTLWQLCFDNPKLIVFLFCEKARRSFFQIHIIALVVVQWSRDIMLWHLCAWSNFFFLLLLNMCMVLLKNVSLILWALMLSQLCCKRHL